MFNNFDNDFDKNVELKAKNIIDDVLKFDFEVLEYQKDVNGFSVLVGNKKREWSYWIDIWIDSFYCNGIECFDIGVDWNKYIFCLDDFGDCVDKKVIEDGDVFSFLTSEAINYLYLQNKINQNNKGDWFIVEEDKKYGNNN